MLLASMAHIFCQEVTVEAALQMAAEGKLREAEAALRILAAKNPHDGDLRYRLGLVLLKQTKMGEAAEALQEAARIDPDSVFPHLALGDVYLRQGNRPAAAQEAARAEPLAGGSVAAWKALATLQGRIEDAAGQAHALQATIRLAPGERGAYSRLASLLVEHRNAEGARAVADAGLRLFPADAELLRLRGLAFYGLGRKQEALDSFLTAMDTAPDSETVHASVETLIDDAGDRLPQITSRLRRFRERHSASPLGPFLLALATRTSTDRFHLLQQAISVDSGFWPAYFELHRVLREQSKREEAIEALETTLRLNPNHEPAHFALAELYLEAGDRERARQHRLEHHRLRAAAAAADQKRAAEAPRFAVTVQ